MAVTVTNTTASLTGKTLLKAEDAQTITGQKAFNIGASSPFLVNVGALKVDNLDADKLDGEEGTAYHNAALLTGSAPLATLGLSAAMINGGRLSLTTALPVTAADVTGASAVTIFFMPYRHNLIGLYTAAAWEVKTFAEVSIAIPAVANQMYDVFAYNNAGVITLEVVAWTNDTARATAIVRQDGVWCKTGALDRRYLGSFRTTAVAGQSEDSAAKRYLFNAENRVNRFLQVDGSGQWTYTTNTWRQANSSAVYQVDIVVGLQEFAIDVKLLVSGSNSTASIDAYGGIGYDVTNAASGMLGVIMTPANYLNCTVAEFTNIPAVGRHFYAWLERSTAIGTMTWYGSGGVLISGLRATFLM